MNDYAMSDDLFRQRALEEDGCMITAVGAGLAKEMTFDGVNVSLNEEQRRFVQGKIQEGQFRSVNDLFQEPLRILESYDRLKTVQIRDLRARISDSISAVERVETSRRAAICRESDLAIARRGAEQESWIARAFPTARQGAEGRGS